MIEIKDLEEKALELWAFAKQQNDIAGMAQALHFMGDIRQALGSQTTILHSPANSGRQPSVAERYAEANAAPADEISPAMRNLFEANVGPVYQPGRGGPYFVPEYHAYAWNGEERRGLALEPKEPEPATARHEYRAQAVAAKFPPFVK
jgi:hypothetical protein